MLLMNTHSTDRLDTRPQNSPHHSTNDDLLHHFTSEMASNPITPNMYYPSFTDSNIPISTMNYPYHPMSQESIDLTYMLTTNMPVPHNLLVDETPQAGPSGLQNGRVYDTSSKPASPPHYNVQSQPTDLLSHQSPMATPIQSPQTSSFPTAVHNPAHAHTMLPPIVHPDPSDPASKFGADSRTLNKRVNSGTSTDADPYAAAFIQEQLGDAKWSIFSARLFERRLGLTKHGSKNKSRETSAVDSKSERGSTAIDFLVKVEVVKEILRTYVPHPYNPLKSLTHEYTGSPTGEVTLTRSTVLALSGWSNTQFSYWVRRGEAISTLRDHDARLGALASILERRLRNDIGADLIVEHSDASLSSEEQRSESPGSTPTPGLASRQSSYVRPEDLVQGITGKGLDVIIDEVKRRSGASQFLRGKHSSLDPFGATCLESENGGAYVSAPFYTPTFQAMEYTHSLPPPSTSQPETKKKPKGRGKTRRNSDTAPESSSFGPQTSLQINVGGPCTSDSCEIALPQASRFQAPVQSTFNATSMIPNAMFSHNTRIPSRHVVKEAVHPSSARREFFPVSDSRSELENVPQSFKRNGDIAESPSKKRTRQ